jgi:tight adherence protein C
MLELATIATFAFIACLVWLAASWLTRPRYLPASGLLRAGVPARAVAGPGEVRRSVLVESLAGQLPQVPVSGGELDKDLRRAGYYRPYARQRFLALRNVLTILAVLVTGALAVMIGPENQSMVVRTIAIGFVAAVLCFSVPRIVLAIQARQRVERIRAGLPDALDTVNMCLLGGVSLQECLTDVGREMLPVHPDLALELLIVGQQAEINSFEFAIQQFAARIDAPEVVALASLISQNQRLGTSVVESIREFADSLRAKRRQLAEAKAARAELFLLFPVIFCLVPAVLLLLWGPSLLQIWDFLRGLAPPITTGL